MIAKYNFYGILIKVRAWGSFENALNGQISDREVNYDAI